MADPGWQEAAADADLLRALGTLNPVAPPLLLPASPSAYTLREFIPVLITGFHTGIV